MLQEDRIRLNRFADGLSSLGRFELITMIHEQEWTLKFMNPSGNEIDIARITYNQNLSFDERFKIESIENPATGRG
ncbi:MAG TPA: hypothetical protein V6D12_13770 [Candidatus Obscuribacterales bacterium]